MDLKDDELNVIRKCLKNDDLSNTEEKEADRLLEIIDRIVEERSRPRPRRPQAQLTLNG